MKQSYGEIFSSCRKNYGISKKKLAEYLDISIYEIYCFEEDLVLRKI